MSTLFTHGGWNTTHYVTTERLSRDTKNWGSNVSNLDICLKDGDSLRRTVSPLSREPVSGFSVRFTIERGKKT